MRNDLIVFGWEETILFHTDFSEEYKLTSARDLAWRGRRVLICSTAERDTGRGRWVGGRLKLIFSDQSTKIIPALVGDLDDLCHVIRSQLQKVDRSEITEP